MTVSSETYRNAYAGNDIAVEFAIDFYFLADADIKAVLSVDATGVETELELTTHYTLVGAGVPAGGTLTMLTAPATGETLTITRNVALTQGTDYIENSAFPADSHEQALDRLTMIAQQIREIIDRTLKLPISQTADPTLPAPVASEYIRYNAAADGFETFDITDLSLYTVSAFAATLLDDASASAARTTLGLDFTSAIVGWPVSTPPTGWLECDGAAVSRTTYAALFAVISDDYGNGDGSTTFNVPDYRGEHLRGYDHGAGTDPDAASRTDRGDGTTGDHVGTKQADEFKAHTHPTPFVIGSGDMGMTLRATNSTPTWATDYTGGSETRPTNVSVMWCIKY